MTALTGLQCHVCQAPFPAEALYVCDKCFGPLEAVYDYDVVRAHDDARRRSSARPHNLWRYRELLPITGEPRTGFNSGFTPLVRADRLADAARRPASSTSRTTRVNHPTLSYKDRVVSVAATRAVELGFNGVRLRVDRQPRATASRRTPRASACSCYVFIPDNLEPGKVLGSAIFSPTADRHPRQLRRREPAVHAGRRQVRLGLRQHQPAHLLRRGRQDVRLRDRRAARLAIPAARRLAGRRRHAAAAHRARLPRAARTSASSTATLPKIYAAQAAGCAPVVKALARGHRSSRSRCGPTPSPSRSPSATRPTATRCSRRCSETGGSGAMVTDERDPRRHPAARRDRRHLHRAGRRHDAGGHDRS